MIKCNAGILRFLTNKIFYIYMYEKRIYESTLIQRHTANESEKEGRTVSNIDWNIKRFNEKYKRNYIMIITMEY